MFAAEKIIVIFLNTLGIYIVMLLLKSEQLYWTFSLHITLVLKVKSRCIKDKTSIPF